MEWQYTPYSIPLAICSAGSLLLTYFVLKNRHTAGAIPFAALLLAIAEWTAS